VDRPLLPAEPERLGKMLPGFPRLQEARELVETLVHRMDGLRLARARVPTVPLAKQSSRVAPGFQRFRERDLGAREVVAVPCHAVVDAVLAREDRGSARSADGG